MDKNSKPYFGFLSERIRKNILEHIEFQDDKFSSLHKCLTEENYDDWNYWRIKAEKELNVPNWYFTLPFEQSRPVSAYSRFLEITSKFWLTKESVARIENGKLRGIYLPPTVLQIAKKQGNFSVYKDLKKKQHFLTEKENVKNAEWTIICKRMKLCSPGSIMFSQQFGHSLSNTFYFSEGVKKRKDIFLQFENLLRLLSERKSNKIEKILKFSTSFLELGILASTGNEGMIPIVKKFFLDRSPEDQTFILNFSIGARNLDQFKELFFSVEIPQKSREILICRAYYVAWWPLIEFLEQVTEKGYFPSDKEKIDNLYQGYLFEPRPVEVYQILTRIVGNLSQEHLFVQPQKYSFHEVDNPFFTFRDLPVIDIDIFIFLGFKEQAASWDFNMGSKLQGIKFPLNTVSYSVQELKKQDFNFFSLYQFAKPILRTLLQENGINYGQIERVKVKSRQFVQSLSQEEKARIKRLNQLIFFQERKLDKKTKIWNLVPGRMAISEDELRHRVHSCAYIESEGRFINTVKISQEQYLLLERLLSP